MPSSTYNNTSPKNDTMATVIPRSHKPRNSCQISVLSSLWDDDNIDNSTMTKNDTTIEDINPAQAEEKPVSVSPIPNAKPNGPVLTDTFQSPTTSIENLRRAAPGVRTRITSLENEVMRSKSPLDKLKEQTRKNNVRKLSEEYEAARSKWVRIANIENATKANNKPFGLRALNSSLSIRSIARSQEDGLPKPKSEEKLEEAPVSEPLPLPKPALLACLTNFQKEDFCIHRGDLVVSPVASSCYSVTVPETQTTIVESMRQVSLMSNMSQYNMGIALYGTPSRPGSSALFPKSEELSPQNSTINLTAPNQEEEEEEEEEEDDDVASADPASIVADDPVDASAPADISEPVLAPAPAQETKIPTQEDGRISRASSHYSEVSALEDEPSQESACRDSGRYSAQWTELTELTIPTIDLDKNEDANRFSLTFPENIEYVPNEASVVHHHRPRSRSMHETSETSVESPKKLMLKNMFRRSKSIDINTAVEFRKSWPLAAISVANDPTYVTKDAIARSASVMGTRQAPDTSMEVQVSELAHHNHEPTDSSEHSFYGYMTPSQKAIRLLKKVAHPMKWREAREHKKAKATKMQEAQRHLACGYSSAVTPTTCKVARASVSPTPNAATTITLVEALHRRPAEKKDRSTLAKLSRSASKLLRRDSSKKKNRKSMEFSASSMPSPVLPAIPVTQDDEFSFQ